MNEKVESKPSLANVIKVEVIIVGAGTDKLNTRY
ncbi:MAG: hypothetical protein ACI9JM_002638 [Halioglobus sp.]|jgi:hypothetical protein